MTYMNLIGIVFWMMFLGSLGTYGYLQWKASKSFRKGNCLLWRHPENNEFKMAQLEYTEVADPPGGYWFDKKYWWLPEKKIRWCYELKIKDGDNTAFKLMPFEPEEWLDVDFPTARSLGDATDTTVERRVQKPRSKLLQNLAWGGTAVMGGVCVIGIMMLADMLGQGGPI